MIEPELGLRVGLIDLVDWPFVLSKPRYAGGHEEVMESIFGSNATVVARWSDNDYQGQVAFAIRIPDGRVVVMTDYYGSCSGCDSWEDADESMARSLINDLANNAKVFKSVEDAAAWCASIDEHTDPHNYCIKAAKNLKFL